MTDGFAAIGSPLLFLLARCTTHWEMIEGGKNSQHFALLRRKSILLTSASLFLLAISHAFFAAPRQPSFQGKTLQRWLDILYPPSGSPPWQAALAERAVKQIGRDGLPWLVGWLNATDNRYQDFFGQQIYPYLISFGFDRIWRPALDYRVKAVSGFKALGRIADPAVPQLVGIARSSTEPGQPMIALEALCAIGTEHAFDAVMSLESKRPIFTHDFLINTFIARNPELAEHGRRKSERNIK